MNYLIGLAMLIQTVDAANTCRILSKGGTELNPLLPQSCKGIVAMKIGLTAPIFIFKGKNKTIWTVSMLASGSVGVVITLSKR